ncbi:MAG: hypothetical protein QOK37_2949 [Thermoanaerobaculia bacterium]|jgi:hypothetical protein|nr:hypothetical protein [Thermoanaerobaculia bacterium]
MPANVDDATAFSWLKALGHSVAAGAAFLLPSLALSIAGLVNATKAGEFGGGFLLPGLILGWIWSYARQRRHSALAHSLLAILVIMSAYEVAVLGIAVATRNRPPSASSIEGHSPIIHQTGDGSVLCQQDIGLRLPLEDSSLSPAPALAEALKKKDPNEEIARWVYRESSGTIVVLMAAKGFDSEESLRNFLHGASSAAEGRMVKTNESVEWNDGKGSIVLSFQQGTTARFDMRCVSAPNGNLACLQTVGSGPDRLAGLRSRLSLEGCP